MNHSGSLSSALSTLLEALRRKDNVRRVCGPEVSRNERIVQLTEDSREAGPNSLFVAVPGERTDGHDFIADAVENGAAVVVCERVPPAERQAPQVTYLQVHHSRRALLTLAHEFYGAVMEQLTFVGITGTNGKTTTAHLVYHALQAQDIRVGMIGTLGAYVGRERRSLELTTPGVVEQCELWREMAEADCTVCVMEVSSHALAQDRVEPASFGVGVFTNLSHDHLDYHGDFSRYARTKKRLFDRLHEGAAAVYNADDSAGIEMVKDTRARRLSYGIENPADLHAEDLENSLEGLRFRLGDHAIESRLTGRFNVYNLLAAAGACRAAAPSDLAEIVDSLGDVPPVPGRLERLVFDDETTVFVDYAHTPDALENVLETLREAKPSGAALWCVFGCGGDRDKRKRPIMGRTAERLADRVVVTSDNPRTEDPAAIVDAIVAGMQDPAAAERLVDRRSAIDYAARTAAPGDVVLIAGKGHETYQVRGTEKVPFDDREEVRRAFSTYRRKSAATD